MKKIVALCLCVLLILSLGACSGMEWPNTTLGNVIPKMENAKGEISWEDSDSLRIVLEDVKRERYEEYVNDCKEKGFTIDVISDDDAFVAFNATGYKIDISYFSDEGMWINVEAPIKMANFTWPNSEISKLIPKLTSNYGKIEWEKEKGFLIYVGKTTKDEYRNYVDLVYDGGFDVDYSRGDDYFWADNDDGYHVEIRYKGFNTVFVKIDKHEHLFDEEIIEPTCTEQGYTTYSCYCGESYTDNYVEKLNHDFTNYVSNNDGTKTAKCNRSGCDAKDTIAESGTNPNDEQLVNGMRPSIKNAIDEYEEFFDDYCEFMKEYSASGGIGMIDEYLEFLKNYNEAMNALNEMQDKDLNSIELVYYTQAMSRITQKLLEIS